MAAAGGAVAGRTARVVEGAGDYVRDRIEDVKSSPGRLEQAIKDLYRAPR